MSYQKFYWALPAETVSSLKLGPAMVRLSVAHIEHRVKPNSEGKPEILFARKADRDRAIELLSKDFVLNR